MKDVQKPGHISLVTLVNHLKEGRFVIPDFQREFEWEPWDVQDLMQSIFLDYYIGSLLLWKGESDNFDALHCEDIYGFGGSGKPELIVLDGQQRLTAIYYTLVAPDVSLPNRVNRYMFFIHVDKFMADDYESAFEYNWTQGGLNLLADTEEQYRRHAFPMSVVGRGPFTLPTWLSGYEQFWDERAKGGEAGAKACAENAALFMGWASDWRSSNSLVGRSRILT